MFPCLAPRTISWGKIDHRRHEHNKFRISQYISCPMQCHCYKLSEFGATLACKSSATMSSNCSKFVIFFYQAEMTQGCGGTGELGCSQLILHGTFSSREGVQVVEYHLFSHTLFYNTLLVWISPEQFSIFSQSLLTWAPDIMITRSIFKHFRWSLIN